jgi:5'-methylthioadenosine phosphorylase
VDQFLDFTKGRVSTFFDGGAKGLLHVDMTDPYCREVREEIYNTAVKLGLNVHKGGCYVTAEGPRFETPAEIKMYKMLGGDLVGMTSVPEVVLAREAGLCYATVAMVTNFAAGISPTVLSHSEVVEAMKTSSQDVSRLIMSILETISLERGCTCSETATEVR